jgi:hypothetical protein
MEGVCSVREGRKLDILSFLIMKRDKLAVGILILPLNNLYNNERLVN